MQFDRLSAVGCLDDNGEVTLPFREWMKGVTHPI